MNIGIIGHGAIGALLARLLAAENGIRLVAVLDRAEVLDKVRAAQPDIVVTSGWSDFIASGPEIVVECAGHEGLRRYGPQALRAGRMLVVSSVGAMADEALEAQLRDAATTAGARLAIPSGAAGGLDVLNAASRAGLDRVAYLSRKLPRAWAGTKAEGMIDLSAVSEPSVFFEGDARQAALLFPQNANVVAAIALAGIGFARTSVRLMADPSTPGNRHVIDASGAFGDISVSVLGKPLPDNPKTSMLAPYSLVRTVTNLAQAIVI